MKRSSRRNIVMGALGALLTAVLLLWLSGPTEPRYQGKGITRWIREAADVGIFEQSDETKTAMTVFGTNAVPFLVSEFTRPIAPRKERLYACLNDLMPFGFHVRSDEERVVTAGWGFMLLETNATPALPVLVGYIEDPKRSQAVIGVFAAQGDAAMPYLSARLASADGRFSTNVMQALVRLSERSGAARDVLPGEF